MFATTVGQVRWLQHRRMNRLDELAGLVVAKDLPAIPDRNENIPVRIDRQAIEDAFRLGQRCKDLLARNLVKHSMPRSNSTHEQFMQDLTDLMLREGVSRLTVAEIAARLRCSRRRLYDIAPSKEGLFLKVAGEMFRSVREQGWALAEREHTSAAKFTVFLGAGITVVHRTTDAFYRDMDALPAGRALFDRHQRERIGGLERLIEEGIRSGEFAPFHSRVVAETLLSAARRMREPDFSARTGATFEAAFSELSRLILNGLLRQKRSAAPAGVKRLAKKHAPARVRPAPDGRAR